MTPWTVSAGAGLWRRAATGEPPSAPPSPACALQASDGPEPPVLRGVLGFRVLAIDRLVAPTPNAARASGIRTLKSKESGTAPARVSWSPPGPPAEAGSPSPTQNLLSSFTVVPRVRSGLNSRPSR